MSTSTFLMPQLPDVLSLVEIYKNNAEQGRPLLANKDLGLAFDSVLESGEAVVHFISIDETYTQPADFDLDDVWGGLNQAVVGIQRMCTRRGPTSLTTNQEEFFRLAHQIQQYWIGGDLKFLKLPYNEEWRESQIRILRINEAMSEGLLTPTEALTAIGLGWTIERLLAVHKTYGRVLGLGERTESEDAIVVTWEKALDHFLSGIKYHHGKDPKVCALFLGPYETALSLGRDRRRAALAKRAAKKKGNPPT